MLAGECSAFTMVQVSWPWRSVKGCDGWLEWNGELVGEIVLLGPKRVNRRAFWEATMANETTR